MKSLFIDTATEKGSIAFYENDCLKYSRIFNQSLRHLARLHAEIQKMIKKLHINIRDIDLYGADIGPGSFTGIRIGVTAVRALAQFSNKKIA